VPIVVPPRPITISFEEGDMRRLSLAIALGLGLVGPVQAQRISYDRADTDKDGRVSRDEYRASRERQFGRFDTNGDGVVSSHDFVRMSTYRNSLAKIDRALATVDTDGDGVISREDVHTAGTPLFDKADADHDGFLTGQEMATLREEVAARRRASL
jgi:Ca2+-binding EF-hand superfamily protein